MKFENNEEKLKHIGLMCCANLHDAFSNIGKIQQLCSKSDLTEKERFSLIKETAEKTYELFRGIEAYRNQSEKAIVKTFMVGEIGKMMERYFKSDGLELNIINDYELTCQKTLLIQILINLINNSYVHNRYDKDNKWKETKVILTIDKNNIIVSDDGIGIPDSIKDKIFNLFFTTKDLDKLNGNNNGIGLFGVKQHIDKLGFKISVDNATILNGANFTITTY